MRGSDQTWFVSISFKQKKNNITFLFLYFGEQLLIGNDCLISSKYLCFREFDVVGKSVIVNT